MAVFKFISSKGTAPAALQRAVDYITDMEKVPLGCIGSTHFPASKWGRLVAKHKSLYGKSDMRQYQHSVISFSVDEPVRTDSQVLEIAGKIAELFEGLPTIYAVHDNTEHIHAHFVTSATCMSGKQFGMSQGDFAAFMSAVGDLMETYGCQRPLNEEPIYIDEEDLIMADYFEIASGKTKDAIAESKGGTTTPKVSLVRVNEEPQQLLTNRQMLQQFVDTNMGYGYSWMQNVTVSGNDTTARNRVMATNHAEVIAPDEATALAVMEQLNQQFAATAYGSLSAIQNSLPVDVVVDFAPRVKIGKK